MSFFRIGVIMMILMMSLVPLYSTDTAVQKRSMNRDEIPAKYKWNFDDLYPNYQEWEKAMADLETKMQDFVALKGTLGQSVENLLKALKLQDEIGIKIGRIYRYPQLMWDADTRNREVAGRFQQVQIMMGKFGVQTSWVNPEMLQIPWDTMKQWLDSTPGLAPYRFPIEDLYRQQAHVLDEAKENLLAYYSQYNDTPNAIYTSLATTDINFPTIRLADDQEIQVTSGNYSRVLATDFNQENRKKVFEAHYNVYNAFLNTYSSIYKGIVLRDWAKARARNYKSTLEAALDSNKIPVEVYETLIKTAKANVGPMQRYNKLRAKILNLKEYHLYDAGISLTDYNATYSYDQAVEWISNAVAPLGKDFQDKLKKAVASGWIDVYENTGKRSGAYSGNVYGVHPYMLLNFNDTLNSVFTLAHELGHTVHSMYTNENQPYSLSDYTLFVAEVSSTFNERLLLDYLLQKSKEPKERIALLQQAINNLMGTFYNQALFADYELQVHRLAEEEKPITADVLNQIMLDLYKTYYGDLAPGDDLIKIVWARVAHFYRVPYYVYQYATCYAASAQIYARVTKGTPKERKAAAESYLSLLKSGGNDFPVEQLKKAGVDLTTPEPMQAVAKQLDELVTMLEKEIDNLAKVKK